MARLLRKEPATPVGAAEQLHQQMTEELGLAHVEGRPWDRLHHHVLLTQINLAFLQPLRLYTASAKHVLSLC
jgi:SRSO17 transposase